MRKVTKFKSLFNNNQAVKYSQPSLLLIFVLLALTACNFSRKNKTRNTVNQFHKIEYSKQFGLIESDKTIQLLNINKTDTLWSYTFEKTTKTPTIIVLSTVFAGFLELLKQQSNIIGVDNFHFYSDSILINQFNAKQTLEVGEESQLQLEKVLSLKPDIVICNGANFIESANGKRLEKMGIKVIYCDNFKEAHPLARAEWIKFFGALTGHLSLADSIFEQVKNNYNLIAFNSQKHREALLAQGKAAPKILSEAMFGDTWFVPGGGSYTAQLIEDAGGSYCFKSLQPLFTYPKSLENVLQEAKDADIWIHMNQFASRSEILQADTRYNLFKAFKTGQLFNNNKQENQYGGNAFWEYGVGRPDLILQDLYTIFKHPTAVNSGLNFYMKLN
ncbi:MAG: ABC transporter substrate-binding protein [bacterium]|nr:ABC transporter substrate-binding protein [bacterium]